MAVAHTERFTDENGGNWKIVSVTHQGGVRLYVTDPCFREHELTKVPSTLPDRRISVDAETPLPLEIP